MRFIAFAFLAPLVLFFGPAPVAARPPLARNEAPTSIAGVVVDDTGGVVPGAAVRLRVAGRSLEETFSDAEGRFAFDAVPPGPATVSVTLNGFAAATLDVSGARAPLRIVLQPGAVTERITVRADAADSALVTSATRTATPLRDVPQAVTIVTQQVMADQGMQNMADVVRYVPGIGMAQGEGNRDTPIFRGNSSTADFFVDGARDDVQYFRDLYNVERVEALKGPNAMMFGRGGAGGVINRVTRQATFSPVRDVTLQAGGFGNRRATFDVGQGVTRRLAARVTGMYEKSGSYRNDVDLRRYGFNPTMALSIGAKTMVTAGVEHFHDDRTADRGIPSFAGRPIAAPASTFFGDPDASRSRVTVNSVTASLERRFGATVALRNRTRFADYDKFYQNVFPGAVNAAGTSVQISAYNNATQRRNASTQTDLTWSARTGRFRHTLLAGGEFSRQVTSNLRHTGYFPSAGAPIASVNVPVAAPTVALPVQFRQGATDADNDGTATVAAVYLQDQLELSPHLQAIVGLRYDDFEVNFHNRRLRTTLRSIDRLFAPRVGVVYKPALTVSIYTSYSLAYLPRAGEQLSSLSLTNQALDPERFRNYEVGSKWDVNRALSVTAALYRLDRSNVAVPDPLNPAVSVLVDGQRTRGLEVGMSGRLTGAWSVMAAYAYQHGEITRSLSATAKAGARLAQVPAHSLSIWNRYDVTERLGAGLGIVRRADMFASTENTVVLPRFTRLDAAVFLSWSRRLRAQANLENLLSRQYYASANGNNNITPGSPRSVRVSVTTSF